jgi:signal transduction histidine kinase
VFLQGPSLEAIVEQVAALPPRTVVLLGPFLRDATGREFSPADASTRIAAASKVPVHTVSSAMLGSGVVGGHVVSFEAHGREAGRLAAGMLSGTHVPPSDAATNVPTFDARQLRRWGLDARRLPPSSTLLFGEPTVWTRYRHYIYLSGAILVVQSGLIATLLVQRSKRRRAEEALASRLRFETLLADLSAVFVSRAGEDVNQHIQTALRRIGDELGIDRVTVGELVAGGTAVHVTHWWVREGTAPLPAILDPSRLPWVIGRVLQGQSVYVSRHADLPAEAGADRRTMTTLGTRSLAVLPLAIGGSVTGLLALAVTRAERPWSSDLASRLTLLAEVFAGALARQRAEQAMEEARNHREEIAHVQRVTMLGELTAALAHELSQPLSAIVMNAQAADRLLRDAASGRAKVREALADICTESQRAMRVFKGLRALFRKERTAYGAVSVNALVEEVAGLLRGELKLKGIALEVALDPEEPRLLGDAVQLQQVLLNLLINAAQAISAADGGPREIAVTTAHRLSEVLHVTVRDTGVGVPEARLEQIFTRFVSDKPGGLGMGLTICRSIVQQHGGQIWAARNPGRGLTVHVELPLAQAPAAVAGPL